MIALLPMLLKALGNWRVWTALAGGVLVIAFGVQTARLRHAKADLVAVRALDKLDRAACKTNTDRLAAALDAQSAAVAAQAADAAQATAAANRALAVARRRGAGLAGRLAAIRAVTPGPDACASARQLIMDNVK